MRRPRRPTALTFARDLFRNGFGQVASRLVLRGSGGEDHGGWCEAAVRDRAERLVAAAVAAERERCARIVESYSETDPDRAIAAAAAEIRRGR